METELLFWPAKNGKLKFCPAVFPSRGRMITIKKKKSSMLCKKNLLELFISG